MPAPVLELTVLRILRVDLFAYCLHTITSHAYLKPPCGISSLAARLVKAGNPTHPVSWLSPVGSILGIGPSLCYHPGGLFDVVLVTLAAALGSNLLERQAPAAVVLRSFAGVKEAWERVLRQNKMVSRRMLGGVVAVLCAKDLATERVAAAAVVFMLSEEGVGTPCCHPLTSLNSCLCSCVDSN